MGIKDFLVIQALRLLGFKWATLRFVDQNKWSDEYIMNILKTNGFVEMNRRGNFYIKDFVMIELVKGDCEDVNNGGVGKIVILGEKHKKTNNECIVEIRIKHNIDSVVNVPVKEINLACKVTGLQTMINYFNRI